MVDEGGVMTVKAQRAPGFRAALCIAAAVLLVVPIAATSAEVGAAAPAFSLPGSDGQTHALSDSRGRWVVIAFFPKAFTGG